MQCDVGQYCNVKGAQNDTHNREDSICVDGSQVTQPGGDILTDRRICFGKDKDVGIKECVFRAKVRVTCDTDGASAAEDLCKGF